MERRYYALPVRGYIKGMILAFSLMHIHNTD